MKFLGNVLASILGTLLALGILFMFFLLLMAGAKAASEPVVRVKDNSVLKVDLAGIIPDYGGQFRITDLDIDFEEYNGLNALLRAIEHAATDDKIEGISIENTFVQSGSATVTALRDALERFKESGKFVYAYGDIFSQKDYWLATVADSVFLHPEGVLDFRGLSSEVLFFGKFQEQSGIKMEVIRHGKYKSAVEPFLGDSMSEENRLQITELLNSIWETYVADIASSRNLTPEKLNAHAEALGARSPELALENGFVDGLLHADEYDDLLAESTGMAHRDDLHTITLERYAEYSSKAANKRSSSRIAVVYAQGQIGYGEGNNNTIAQGIMYKALKEARQDDRIKAVVLRVNSPGGLALTSDMIWREVGLTAQEKPVVVSMGDVAASGGYYIAAAADYIFAEPTTITGSIGVFATIPNVSGLAEKWGINAEQVNTHKHATGYSLFEEPSEDFRRFSKESVENNYRHFLDIVAQGRDMTPEAVNEVAQGRVWSGIQAVDNGLVDALGGLDDAVAYAAEQAGVSEYSTEDLPVYRSSFSEILDELGIGFLESREDIMRKELGEEYYRLVKYWQEMVSMEGLQARMPFEIQIN